MNAFSNLDKLNRTELFSFLSTTCYTFRVKVDVLLEEGKAIMQQEHDRVQWPNDPSSATAAPKALDCQQEGDAAVRCSAWLGGTDSSVNLTISGGLGSCLCVGNDKQNTHQRDSNLWEQWQRETDTWRRSHFGWPQPDAENVRQTDTK